MGDWFNINTFLPKLDHIYDHRQVETINKSRKELGGTLFFDRIWNSLDLSPAVPATKIYPPKSAQELKQLWQRVLKADSDETAQATPTSTNERKQAVLFYILRDCARQQQQSSAKSSTSAGSIDPSIKFARVVYLPRKYQVLVSGLWELDHLQFPLALSHLTDPIVGSEFAAEIMEALLTHQSVGRELTLAYFHAKSPPLDRPDVREGVFQLLLEGNVVEAYNFCERQPGDVHRMLFLDLVESVLSQQDGLQKAMRAQLMVSLPLTAEEDSWLEEFLLSGGGSKLPGAKDTVMVRRLARGKAIEGTSPLANYRGQKIGGIDWDDVRLGLQSSAA